MWRRSELIANKLTKRKNIITEIVYLDFPAGVNRDEVLTKHRTTAEALSQNTEFIEKYYFVDAESVRGGGIYIWKTIEAEKKWHGTEYMRRILDIYGGEVSMIWHDTFNR